MRLTESIYIKLKESESSSFKSKLESVFDSVKEGTDENQGSYELNNSGIYVADVAIDENGDYTDGFQMFSDEYVFPQIDGLQLDIQAPDYLKDSKGNEYGSCLTYFGEIDANKVKEVFDKANSVKKRFDSENRDSRGYATVVESSLNESKYSNVEETDPVLDKTIKVYDINAFIDKEVNPNSDIQYRAFDFDGGAAIIVKSDGSGIIADYEGVGYSFNSTSEEKTIYICPKDGDDGNGRRTISIMATASFKATIDELMQAPSKEMKVKDFFYKWNYNDRCARNFENIKPYLTECDKTLKEDALSSDEYYVIGKDDFQALLDKNGGAFENGYLAITKDEANELAKKQGLLVNSNGVFSGEEERNETNKNN